MKRWIYVGIGLLSGLNIAFAGEAVAVSVASNGGRASANATAVGNSSSTAIAGATRGGTAIANSDAYGNRRGYADSRAVATADRGLAISNSVADARGSFGGVARADSESIAAAVGGVALSNSRARADGILYGDARSRSTSTAISEYGYAVSDSDARSVGLYGGRAVSDSNAESYGYGGRSVSRVLVDSDARYFAVSEANGLGVSHSGLHRSSTAVVRASSRAIDRGYSRSNGVVIEVRP